VGDMQVLNKQYMKESSLDSGFWREIGVKHDAIHELESILVHSRLKSILAQMKMPALNELRKLYQLGEFEDDESLREALFKLDLEERKLLLKLHDFSNRKKKSLDKYYESVKLEDERYDKSSLAKLLHLFHLSPVHLIELFTWYLWDNKASGKLFVFDKENIPYSEAKKIAEEYTYNIKLRDILYKASGSKNQYRVYSYSIILKKVLVLLYRQISDAPRADFVSAPRNREVSPTLFLIDIDKKTVEIKSLITEEGAIKNYLQSTLGSNLGEIQSKVFVDYNKEVFVNSILKGSSVTASGDIVTDFTVFKIKFRGTPLKNSPQVTLELDSLDIWPSVEEAHTNGTINLESIKDLESIQFKSSLGNRLIRSTVLDNGNVIFTMDDSNLDSVNKKRIEEKFLDKFGVPLYREISNELFDEGKADKVDYLMTISTVEKPSEFINSILTQLIKQSILMELQNSFYYCPHCRIEYVYEEPEEVPHTCKDCDGDRISKRSSKVITVNLDAVYGLIKKRCNEKLTRWELVRENVLKVGSVELKCLHLSHQQIEMGLQIVITDKSLQKSALKQLNRLMKPTILVLVGQSERLINYSNYSCVEPVNFGKIYIEGEQTFSKLMEEWSNKLQTRTKTFLSAAANEAYNSIGEMTEYDLKNKVYTDKFFEDDVFALLKDIFSNAEKWGKELSGKEVPEGIFALAFKQDGKIRQRVFSYDCKLNTNGKGYDLNKSEQRKAVEYVNTLNSNDYIQTFSDKNQLSGHIFISNQFRSNNFKTMTAHFYEHLNESFDSKAIFLDVSVLCYLHENFSKNHQKIMNNRDKFYRDLFDVLMSGIVNTESVDKVFKKALDNDLAEYKTLPTHKVTKELQEKY
jgi:hypothetical protein